MESKALRRLKENDPFGAIHLYQKISPDFQLYSNRLIPEQYFRGQPPHIAKIPEVVVETTQWFLFKKKSCYSMQTSSLNPHYHPLIQKRYTPDKRFVILKEPVLTKTIDHPCILIGGDDNYCHWFLRYLMKLHFFQNHPEYDQFPLVFTSQLLPFQEETLDMLGIPESRLLKVDPDELILFNELYVPECTRREPFIPAGCEWVRKKFLQKEGKLERKLYVSRSDINQLRYMTNEEEVQSLLENYGFETITPGTLTIKEQIEIFSDASVIIGAHGAGLTNALFAPKGAKLIEFTTPINNKMPDFKLICKGVGLTYQQLLSTKFKILDKENPAVSHNYEVDLSQLKNTISQN